MGTIGSLASINSYAISPSLTGYSIANSAPPSVPMFHPSPASNTWLSSSNGFPALQCAMSNSSDRSSPSNSMQGTPVMAAVQCSNSPMVPMQNSVMQAAVLPHPSSLPPPPSPHSLGIATSAVISVCNTQRQPQVTPVLDESHFVSTLEFL